MAIKLEMSPTGRGIVIRDGDRDAGDLFLNNNGRAWVAAPFGADRLEVDTWVDGVEWCLYWHRLQRVDNDDGTAAELAALMVQLEDMERPEYSPVQEGIDILEAVTIRQGRP